MKNRIIALGIMLFILVLAVAGCSSALANAPVTTPDQNNSQIPNDVVIPNRDVVEKFVKNSSTYRFDGIDGSINLVNATADGADVNWEYTVKYQTGHVGHGDRTGHMMAQVITNHTAVIKMTDGEITSAVCDNSWNMLKDLPINTPQPDVQASLGQEFTLPVGQSAAISGENLVIRFIEVTSDSRSPKGAETIWAGEASCRIQVTYQGGTSEVMLKESGATEGFTEVSLLQYKLNFQLKPVPEVGYQPVSSDYSLLMEITE